MRERDDVAHVYRTDYHTKKSKAFSTDPLVATLNKVASTSNFSRASRETITCPVEYHLASRPLPSVAHISSAIANGQYPRAKSKHTSLQDNCKADRIEYVSDVILGFENEIHKQTLLLLEKIHWNKIYLQSSLGGALITDRVPGRVSYIQIIARPLLQLSLLIIGTQFGQLLFWNIPWKHKEPVHSLALNLERLSFFFVAFLKRRIPLYLHAFVFSSSQGTDK